MHSKLPFFALGQLAVIQETENKTNRPSFALLNKAKCAGNIDKSLDLYSSLVVR